MMMMMMMMMMIGIVFGDFEYFFGFFLGILFRIVLKNIEINLVGM